MAALTEKFLASIHLWTDILPQDLLMVRRSLNLGWLSVIMGSAAALFVPPPVSNAVSCSPLEVFTFKSKGRGVNLRPLFFFIGGIMEISGGGVGWLALRPHSPGTIAAGPLVSPWPGVER
jgi:hypothetical protein